MMALPRIGLLGSCVTFDPVLTLLEGNLDLVWSQARTSIPSMAAPPLHIPIRFETGSMSNFEQRNVHLDLYKSWIASINRKDYDFLLIDFIDERFGCADYDGSRFTWSTAFRAGIIDDDIANELVTTMPTSPKYRMMIEDGLGFVSERINAIDKPVICNNVYWSFEKEDGSVDERFPEARFAPINDNLAFIYRYLTDNTRVTMLDIPRADLKASLSHHWGSAPFHFTDRGNAMIAEAVKALTR